MIEFSEEESIGEVYMAWRGPKYEEFQERVAMELMWTYLSDSPVAVLQKKLVDKNICSGMEWSGFMGDIWSFWGFEVI